MSRINVGSKKNFKAFFNKLNPFTTEKRKDKVKGDQATSKDVDILENMKGSTPGTPIKSFKEMQKYRKKRIHLNKLARKSKQINRG